jgi:hypothetical protein
MMKPNLFAAQEREAKLTKLGDALQVLERHVNFAALSAAVMKRHHDRGTNAAQGHSSRPR